MAAPVGRRVPCGLHSQTSMERSQPIFKAPLRQDSAHLRIFTRLMSGLSGGPGEPRRHLPVIDDSGLLVDDAAVFHHNEIRNVHDAETLCELWPSFCIDFQHDGTTRHLRRGTLNFGRSHSAWTAPGGPEVDQDGNTALGDDLVKGCWIDVHRFGDRGYRGFALPATSVIGEMSRGNPVVLAARCTLANHPDKSIPEASRWRSGVWLRYLLTVNPPPGTSGDSHATLVPSRNSTGPHVQP